jgi:acyl-CoA thioester hydrolase
MTVPPSTSEEQVPRCVSWTRPKPRHCDAQAMVHAIRYYEFFEDAFLDWLDRFAGGYERLRSAGADLVIVENGCEYRDSARLNDLLAVETRPTGAGRSSLSMSFTVRRDERIIVIGHATYVAVSAGAGVVLPEPLRSSLRHVPARSGKATA